MHPLAEHMLSQIRSQDLLKPGNRIGAAVSGGVDSVALLCLLLELRGELGIVLSVVHFNHKLRGLESDADQEFVAGLAREHGLEFHADAADVRAYAEQRDLSVEAAARDLRYGFFRGLLGSDRDAEEPTSAASQPLDKIATGHTLDDQAETVLMRMIRGTGPRGLAGIYPCVMVENDDGDATGEIVRPLLGVRRRELETYLKELGKPWREDSTNTDARFTRNRVRQLLVPVLEREFNPSFAESLSELAEISRGEQDYWDNEIAGWMGATIHWSEPEWARELREAGETPRLVQILSMSPFPEIHRPEPEAGPPALNASVNRLWLLAEPLAVQRRVVKVIGDEAGIPLEFKHVAEILQFAAEPGNSIKGLALPSGWKLIREGDALVFGAPNPHEQERTAAHDYEYPLPLPGRAIVPEAGVVLEAVCLNQKSQAAEYNRQQLLRAELLGTQLTVRNWRPGDRFWPAHTKAPRKIKELLQKRHIPSLERKAWPVVVSGDEIVWVRGFLVPTQFRAGPDQVAVAIRETPLSPSEDSVQGRRHVVHERP